MEAQASQSRLLLVCDEPLAGELLQDMLEGAGYYVRLAISLNEGRLQFRASAYDLVIVNVSGDPADAIEFCHEIKKMSPAQTVAFLAGRWTYVPPRSCADDVLPRDEGPRELLARLAEITRPKAAEPPSIEPGLA